MSSVTKPTVSKVGKTMVTRWWLEFWSWLATIQYNPTHTCCTPVLYPGQCRALCYLCAWHSLAKKPTLSQDKKLGDCV